MDDKSIISLCVGFLIAGILFGLILAHVSNPKFCPECGRGYDKNTVYCSRCGVELLERGY